MIANVTSIATRAPGVYVVETGGGARPIRAVGTSTGGFVGVAPTDARLDEPTRVTNWTEYLDAYVGRDPKARDELAGREATHLSMAVWGFFENGGTELYVVNVGRGNGVTGKSGSGGVHRLDEVDEVAIVAAPGFTGVADYEALIAHCERRKDRIAVLDAPPDATVDQLSQAGVEDAAAPAAEEPPAAGAKPPKVVAPKGMLPRKSKFGFGALYHPWLRTPHPFDPKQRVLAPPSGHVAGVFARVDTTRGVFKAPANEPVAGALGLSKNVSATDQGRLNGKGVNCIRYFPEGGIRIWGARTISDDPEWQYVPVRRLFSMLGKSIERSTQWVVFEPNDRTLWKSIRRDVTAFLTLLWRQGALAGRSPEDAFFVRCDEETNPPDMVNLGVVLTVIGVAAVRPAEFVVFQVGQAVDESALEALGA